MQESEQAGLCFWDSHFAGRFFIIIIHVIDSTRHGISAHPVGIKWFNNSAAAAEAFVAKKLAEYAVGFSASSGNKVTIQELMDDLLLRHKNDGKQSVEDEESRWKNHLQPFFGPLRSTQVTSDLIERYINERKGEKTRNKRPPENATINRESALLKAAYNYGAEKTPPKVIRVPHFRMLEERNVRKGFVKDSEYIRLAQTTAKEETTKLRPWLRGMVEAG